MKAFLILLFLLIGTAISGQEEKTIELGEITVTPPTFMGEEYAAEKLAEAETKTINDFLAKNVIYPDRAKSLSREGIVVAQFVVTETGDISNIEIINPVSHDLDAEVIRGIRKTNGMWRPGSNNGQPLAMVKEACVCFEIGFSENSRELTAQKFTKLARYHFSRGAKRLLEKQHPKAALRAFNNAMIYQPLDKALLLNRSYCKYALGDIEGARDDWNRIIELGGPDASFAVTIEKNGTPVELDPMFTELVINH